jgi:CRP-like cAMP-binding protein
VNEQHFPPGAVIFRPGDPGDRAYLVREGTVELLGGPAGRPALAAAGEVFGELSLIEERPRSLTARAVTAVRAEPLTRDEFERRLAADPSACRPYLQALFERLRVLAARAEEPAPAAPPAAVRVTIHPLTRRAAETLPDEGLPVPKFPFRIGRAAEARERNTLDLNDLWLLDAVPFNVSRNHVTIDVSAGGDVLVKERGSSLGAIVNEVLIGGGAPHSQATLEIGDNTLILGGRLSPYQFRLHVERG